MPVRMESRLPQSKLHGDRMILAGKDEILCLLNA